MKKTLLFSFAVVFAFSAMAQTRVSISANIKNLVAKKPVHISKEYASSQNQALPIPFLNQPKSLVVNYEQIGSTYYDLQTNASVDHRTHLYSDGTIGTVWTIGTGNFADRGTGYSYYDGTAWQPNPTSRIETVRTGWGSYAPLGATGEVVVSHNGTQLVMNKRDTKGTGAWSQSIIPVSSVLSPAAADPTWPRVCTIGDNIHVIAASDVTWGGQTNPIWYCRSTDAGANWDIQNVIPTGLTPADGYTQGFGGDLYDWAEPRNNTLAFVIGSSWTDLILMKSIDNGTSWTKTVIFQHPFPNFDETTTLVGDGVVSTDTPYVADGAHAVVLDATGKAYVAFGIMRVANTDLTDAQTEYYPGTDGLGFWQEGDPTLTDLNPDVLYNNGRLAAWMVDRDGDGSIMEDYTASTQIAYYGLSLSSMPQLALGSAGEVYLVYSSICEDMTSSSSQYYRHVWYRKSLDHGNPGTWGDFYDFTCDFELTECVFPAFSQTSNAQLHFTCQMDAEPGLSVRGDEDPAAENQIVYLTADIADPVNGCLYSNINSVVLSNPLNVFPNPVTNEMSVSFNFNKSTQVKMTIVNLIGSNVMSQEFVSEKGETKKINVSNLSIGIYLAKFETANGTFTQKIMKQ